MSDEGQADGTGDQRLREEVGSERRGHGLDALLAQRDRQRTEAQRVVELRPLDLVRLGLRADRDDGLAAADRALDVRGRDHRAVEGDRSGAVDVRRREVAPDLACLLAERELDADDVAVGSGRDARDVDLAPVEQHADRPGLDQGADVLVVGQGLAHRVDELELAGRADEAADLLGIVDARHLDHDPLRPVGAGLGPNLGLVDADAGHAPLDDRAGGLHVGGLDRLVALGLGDERHPDPALEIEPEHGLELDAGHL